MNVSDTIVAVIAAALFTTLLLAIYKYVINPQMVIPPGGGSPCPDLWSFNPGSRKCEPDYTTNCTPFDPDDSSLKTAESKCTMAHNCGTDWPGNCP